MPEIFHFSIGLYLNVMSLPHSVHFKGVSPIFCCLLFFSLCVKIMPEIKVILGLS